jgi:hypothetical protein
MNPVVFSLRNSALRFRTENRGVNAFDDNFRVADIHVSLCQGGSSHTRCRLYGDLEEFSEVH